MRRVLWVGAAVSSILAAAGAAAQTQGASPAQTPDDPGPATTQAPGQSTGGDNAVQEIVVTGVRRSLENAISTKRDADVVVDAISAEDVGKFPTENVAESLQRVTGVQISRFRGEGNTVTVRGLPSDFTLVELNGHTLANVLGPAGSNVSRSFDFTILPSEFVSKVEVFKTPSADMEEGGLAGTVVARTARPLEIGKRKITANIEEANESNRDQWAPRASAFYTDVFADGKFGVSLGGAYTKRLTETHEQNITRYRRVTEGTTSPIKPMDLNGDGVIATKDLTKYALLDSIFQEIYREDRERKTAMGTIQFKPTDHLDFTLDSFYGKMHLFSPRLSDLVRIGAAAQGPVVAGTSVIDQRPGNSASVGDNGNPVNTIESIDVKGVDERADGRTEARDADLLSVGLNGTWHNDNELKVSTEVSLSRARQVMDNPLEENQRLADVQYDLRPNSDLVTYHYVGADATGHLDPNSFTLLSLNGEWGQRRSDDQRDASIDIDKGVHWGWLDSVKFGGRYAVRSVFQDNRRIAATSTALQTLWGGTPIIGNTVRGAAPSGDHSLLFLVPTHPSTGTFGDANGSTAALFPQTYLDNNPFAFINHFGRSAIENLPGVITNDATGVYDVKEHAGAVYFRANLAAFNNRLTGNVGVRVVRTEQISKGVAPDLNNITFRPQAGSITQVPSAGPVLVDRTYNDVLPSLNLKYDLMEDLVLRASASRTMARPTLTALSPTVGASGANSTITRNNPYLTPFRSNNYDLSTEWYFAEGGLLSAALFYKDIVSQIVPVSNLVPITITQINGDGSTQRVQQNWTVSSLVNGQGISVDGAEISYQQNLDFLPGPLKWFGFLGNYTYLQSHGGTLPLVGASKNNYTASVYYERGWFGGRVSYTYRGKFYVSTEGNTRDQVWEQPFGTLDANVTANIGEHFAVVLEATNILQAVDRRRFEPIDLTADYLDNGRRILAGVRATF
jgi:iron complex outermembrane receptor protein